MPVNLCLQKNDGFCCVSSYLLQLNMIHYLVYSSFQRNICGVLELFSATQSCRLGKNKDVRLIGDSDKNNMQQLCRMLQVTAKIL